MALRGITVFYRDERGGFATLSPMQPVALPLAGRHAFVCGATQGIGKATAIAMASGDIDDAEDKLLETMQRLLDIDDAFAAKVIEVLQTKYTV